MRRQWQAKILEQVPDRKVAWAATEGATNAGSVTFEDLGGDQTSVSLFLEYEPEGIVEKAGDAVHLIERQAQADLDRFKEFIESEQYATGAWRGSVESGSHVGTPGVEAAADSRGDDGKAGVSGKVVAAGVGVAAAAAAAAVVGTKNRSDNNQHDADDAGHRRRRRSRLLPGRDRVRVRVPRRAGRADADRRGDRGRRLGRPPRRIAHGPRAVVATPRRRPPPVPEVEAPDRKPSAAGRHIGAGRQLGTPPHDRAPRGCTRSRGFHGPSPRRPPTRGDAPTPCRGSRVPVLRGPAWSGRAGRCPRRSAPRCPGRFGSPAPIGGTGGPRSRRRGRVDGSRGPRRRQAEPPPGSASGRRPWFPVKLDEGRGAVGRDEAERVHPEPRHGAKRRRDPPVGHVAQGEVLAPRCSDTKSENVSWADLACGISRSGCGFAAWITSGNLSPSWMKKTGMLFPTRSKVPSSV